MTADTRSTVAHPAACAAYIHVPFCRHRCGYCDFPLVAGRDDLIDGYLRALEIELAELQTPREVRTLFCGGGTPTHLPVDKLRRMLCLVRRWFPLAEDYEFSVEANPSGLDEERIGVLREAGVNRISLGVQAFSPRELEVLERDHLPAEAIDVVGRLQQAGFGNLSVDLIFGVPGQSCADWQQSLDVAAALNVQHISAYGLTYEKGTSFWRRREAGNLVPEDEETERAMYAAAMDRLPAAGFVQYEISNHAKCGFECRHNLVYWGGRSYFGFGPGAARFLDGVRSVNHRSVRSWLKRVLAGESGIAESETLDAETAARELIMLGLRLTAGIDICDFRERTGFALHQMAGEAIERFVDDGLLEESSGHLRLTREGRFLADTVTSELL